MRITKPLHVILKQTTASTLRRLTTTTLALALVVGGSLAYQNLSKQLDTAQAAYATLSFSEYATHPHASKLGLTKGVYGCAQDFCPSGQDIVDMEITGDGQLIAGYGDYGSDIDTRSTNGFRVGVMPLDLATGTWGDMYFAGSESIEAIRKINGHIYVPTTDPSAKRAHGQTSVGSGYLTNDTGEWRFVRASGAVHYYDMASLDGNDLWIVGSRGISGGGEAWARRSTDGGQTFTTAQTDRSDPVGAGAGMERYYWTATLKGKVYMQARDTSPATPTRVYDSKTDTWSDITEPGIICGNYHAKQVITFDGSIVCGTGSHNLLSYDGTTVKPISIPRLQASIFEQ